MVPVLVVIAGPPLVAGLRGRPLIGWLWAACLGLVAIITTINEPPHYDMPGFGLKLFGGATALAVLALLAGVALRRFARHDSPQSPRDRGTSRRPE